MMQCGKYLMVVIITTAVCVFADNCERPVEYKLEMIGQDESSFFKELFPRFAEFDLNIIRPPKAVHQNFIFQVSQCKQRAINDLLAKHNIRDFEIVPQPSNRRSGRPTQGESVDQIFKLPAEQFDFDIISKRYLWGLEINLYLEKVAELIRRKNPNIDVRINIEGHSFEERPIKSISIGYKGKSNPTIVMDAGIHAREWHARSLALFVLKGLMNEALLDTNGLIFKTTFVIVPEVNPDGYLFSRNVERMWRKNRRPITGKCIGVDGNRNYDAHWEMGERETIPCQEVYKGNMAFSEPETQAIRSLLTRVRGSTIMYISIHTYGNSILFPNGWTVQHHARHNQLLQIARAGAASATSLYGSKFVADQSGSGLYVAAGGSDDWAIDALNIPFCYTFEIGAEEFGFQVPEEKLRQTVEEGWTAIRAMSVEALSIA